MQMFMPLATAAVLLWALAVPQFVQGASADCGTSECSTVTGSAGLLLGGIYSLHLFGIPTPSIDEGVVGGAVPAIILFGLVHGLSPGHGWPVAIMYSMRSPRPMLAGLLSSGIIAGAHFLSSIVVVVAYIFVSSLVDIPNLYLRLGAAVGLGILAYIFWKEKEESSADSDAGIVQSGQGHHHSHESHDHHEHHQDHDHHDHLHEHDHARWYQRLGHSHSHAHQKQLKETSLKAIAGFALVLGFAHEEEFVILALAAGGGDPVGLMIAYAGAVAASLIGVTLLSLKVYERIQHRVIQYSKYLPKITAILLLVMAVSFATGIGN